MMPRRTFRLRPWAPGTGLILAGSVAALALLASGCRDGRRDSVHEERTASAIALGDQKVVRIETRSADVHVVQSPDDTVRVIFYRRIQSVSARSVKAMAAQIKVTMERQGDLLVFRVREPERSGTRVNVDAGTATVSSISVRRSTEIELTVAVPARASIECETARGDYDAVGLSQPISLIATSGDIELSQLSGPARVQTTSGDVTLRDLTYPSTVRVTAGDIDAINVTGLTVRATSGDVSARGVRGGLRFETSTGDVSASEVSGTVMISTSAGEVELTAAAADSCVIETASGDIEAGLTIAPRHVQVRSSSGDVVLGMPSGAGGALDLQTATGTLQVKSAVDVETMNRNRLTGRLGGAGSVAVRTSSGDITLATHSGVAP
jgi:DUF4097 and DUF4098 domain-containing protein YvlB